MTTYIALLRGINVGGNNKISMAELKTAFSEAGFANVSTYINSGNVIFSSSKNDANVKKDCEALIAKRFSLDIAVCIISAAELAQALANAPGWWNRDKETKHNAMFVIAPNTAQDILEEMGEIKPEYEKIAFHGKLIFWSAPLATFSRTKYGTMASKAAYQKVTIRNANTTRKLAELTQAAS